jgi:copper resistance protein B
MRPAGSRWLTCALILCGLLLTEPAGADAGAPTSVQGMSSAQMSSLMQMDDTEPIGKLLLDELEWRDTSDGGAFVWEGQGSYGGDYDKLVVRSEGERVGDDTRNARVELLWDRIIARWWDLQAGAREDFGGGPPRSWAAFGLAGVAPYGFDTAITLYAGDAGRVAARLRSEVDLLLTQRLILQPQIEANLYGQPDRARRLGSGFSDVDIGLRLRYEVRRELAPYLGIAWTQWSAETARLLHPLTARRGEAQFVAGLRLWL